MHYTARLSHTACQCTGEQCCCSKYELNIGLLQREYTAAEMLIESRKNTEAHAFTPEVKTEREKLQLKKAKCKICLGTRLLGGEKN